MNPHSQSWWWMGVLLSAAVDACRIDVVPVAVQSGVAPRRLSDVRSEQWPMVGVEVLLHLVEDRGINLLASWSANDCSCTHSESPLPRHLQVIGEEGGGDGRERELEALRVLQHQGVTKDHPMRFKLM